MPRKKKGVQQKQKQKQSQRVVVNVGTITKSKKRSGRGGLPPPSHMHNLAPTFVTAPQVDYTPLIAMMQHHARPIVAQVPMPVTQTPLSATIQASTAERVGEVQREGQRVAVRESEPTEARRAGPTASNFQPLPSQADERIRMFEEDKPVPTEPDVFEAVIREKVKSEEKLKRKQQREQRERKKQMPVPPPPPEKIVFVMPPPPLTPQPESMNPRKESLDAGEVVKLPKKGSGKGGKIMGLQPFV